MHKKINCHKQSKSYVAYLMLCISTTLFFLFFIVISISVEVSAAILPPDETHSSVTAGYIYKYIVLSIFALLALSLWVYNWVLISATWYRRSTLLNCILVFVQIFGTFINYVIFFIMFYSYKRWPWPIVGKESTQ